ncbi:MAG: TetR/AcrR family transcriptional regulator [Phycisphaerales bacterium JB040]
MRDDSSQAPTADELVRAPQQDRSRRTLDRIVGAALALIAEKGVDGASVQDIARRARASVGSFYARFKGKEDLLRYLEIQLWTDVDQTWSRALDEQDWSAHSFEDLVATLVGVLAEVNRTGARQRRLLEARRGPEASSEAARAFEVRLGSDIRRLLLEHSDRIEHADPARAVDLCVAAVRGVLRLRDTGSLDATALSDLDEAAWVETLSGLVLAYLTGRGDTEPGRGQMDFFDVWA